MGENIDATINRRFIELVMEGEELVAKVQSDRTVEVAARSACLSWLLSAVNLLEVSMPSDNRYRLEAQRLLPKSDETIWYQKVASILGILKSAATEWRNGLISTLEFRFVALAFEDFLKHA